MATAYPDGFDSFTNPAGTDALSDPAHATQHANVNDAVEAIQATLGLNPEGDEATVSARIAAAVTDAAAAASGYADAASASASSASGSASAADASDTSAEGWADAAETHSTNAGNYASAAADAQVAAESAQAATEAVYDQFDDRYLGAKATAPTTDNDGNALIVGALYFDTVTSSMQVWTGSAWVAADVSYSWTGAVTVVDNSSSTALRVTQTGTGDALRIEDSGNPDSTPLVVDSSGNVGIGTGSPSYLLDVAGTANFTSLLVGGSPLDALPSQTGESGKYLTTDGTDASWATLNVEGTIVTYEFTATASQTVFTGNDDNGVSLAFTGNLLQVFLNGVLLAPGDDFTTSTNTVTLASGAAASDVLVVVAFSAFNVADTYTQGETDALLAAVGAKGAGGDQVFYENDQTVTTSYTITASKNAITAGPVTINSGVTVTVPSGSYWSVV